MKRVVVFSIIFLLLGLIIGFFLFGYHKNNSEKVLNGLETIEIIQESNLGNPSIQFTTNEGDCEKKFLQTLTGLNGGDIYCSISGVFTEVLNSHILNGGTVETRVICTCRYTS